MIILVTVGEPVPKIDKNQRYMRCFNMGLNLSEYGQNVLWITDSFNHQSKSQRKIKDNGEIFINQKFKIKVIKTISYKKNYSIFRVLHNIEFGYKIFKINKYLNFNKKIFISSFPILESCIAVAIIKKKQDKLIIDIRDLWPDVFKDKLNKFFFSLVNFFYIKSLKFIFKKTDMVISTSKGYLDWADQIFKIKKKYFLPIGYNLSPHENMIKKSFKDNKLFFEAKKKFNLCFIGTITQKYFDFEDIIELSNFLNLKKIEHNIFIAGIGEEYDDLKLKVPKNIKMLGQLNGNELSYIMSICSIGLAPYKNIPNFEKNIPNKIYEYAFNNLYLISSLKGDTKTFIEKNKLGFTYKSFKDMKDKILEIYTKNNSKKFINNECKRNLLDSKKINNQFFEKLEELNYF